MPVMKYMIHSSMMPSTGPLKIPRYRVPGVYDQGILEESGSKIHTSVELLPSREVEVRDGRHFRGHGPPRSADIKGPCSKNAFELRGTMKDGQYPASWADGWTK